LRGITQAGTESPDGGLMRERGFGPEVSDGERLLERQRAGHDFPVDRAERIVGHWTFVPFADAMQHGAFAVRRVDFLAGLELDLADREHVFRALVQELD